MAKDALATMKHIAFIMVALTLPFCVLHGQTRYLDEIFSSISMREGVQYGSNINNIGQPVTLYLDYFQPIGDTIARRPVIVFVHGGAFVSGSRTEGKVREFCTRFSRRGYITGSIDYRLGVTNPLSRSDFIQAGYRATQDTKAAVRYFRRQEIADSLHVDTTRIFLGGFSAGAFSALNASYLDVGELPPEIDTTLLGNIEGNSGNPGHSSRVLALMNCWGGVLDTLVIDPGDIPMISVHGTSDPVVPYTSGVSIFAGIYLYGSATITMRLHSLGVASFLIPMPGVGHGFPGDPLQNAFWTDTTIVSTAAFFYPFVAPTTAASLVTSLPDGFVLYQNYPNPFNPSTTIELRLNIQSDLTLTIFDILGRRVRAVEYSRLSVGTHSFEWDGRDENGRQSATGVYFCCVRSGQHSQIQRMLLLK